MELYSQPDGVSPGSGRIAKAAEPVQQEWIRARAIEVFVPCAQLRWPSASIRASRWCPPPIGTNCSTARQHRSVVDLSGSEIPPAGATCLPAAPGWA
jgi:hypothetical protein